MFNLHLDESIDSTSFANEADASASVSCSGNGCPNAGDKGQIREAAVFDGNDKLFLLPDDSTEWALETFTIGGWVKPSKALNTTQLIIQKSTVDRGVDLNFRLYLNSDLLPRFAYYQNCEGANWKAITPDSNVIENQWNHVMVTYDGSTGVLYLNGSNIADIENATGMCAKDTNQQITIGEGFIGSLDEVTIHNTALSEEEVQALYDYQVSWFDVTESHPVVIDAVGPTVEVGVDTDYLSIPTNQVMAISAWDDISTVSTVEYRINGGTWQSATQDNEAWIFTFTPSGETSYSIKLRLPIYLPRLAPT